MKTDVSIRRIEGQQMKVNSYVLETPAGVVVVDGMLTVSDARAVRRHVDERGARWLGAVVTHAHPDHYAGLGEMLRDLDVPIFATAEVRRVIERDDAVKNAIVGPMMGAEWPSVRRFPDREPRDGVLQLGDGAITFTVREIGRGESPADSLFSLDDRHHFVGDLAYNGMHAYLADGHYEDWLAVLARLSNELPSDATLYVGHGEPGPARALLDAQRSYVEAFVDSVRRHRALAPEARRKGVVAEMRRFLATDDLLFLMELSVDPVAEAMA